MSEAHRTTDHDTIRRWAEERRGHPARVKGTGGDGDVGLLRIDFPGYSGEQRLEEISWEEFFEPLAEKGSASPFQDGKTTGRRTRSIKPVGAGPPAAGPGFFPVGRGS